MVSPRWNRCRAGDRWFGALALPVHAWALPHFLRGLGAGARLSSLSPHKKWGCRQGHTHMPSPGVAFRVSLKCREGPDPTQDDRPHLLLSARPCAPAWGRRAAQSLGHSCSGPVEATEAPHWLQALPRCSETPWPRLHRCREPGRAARSDRSQGSPGPPWPCLSTPPGPEQLWSLPFTDLRPSPEPRAQGPEPRAQSPGLGRGPRGDA